MKKHPDYTTCIFIFERLVTIARDIRSGRLQVSQHYAQEFECSTKTINRYSTSRRRRAVRSGKF